MRKIINKFNLLRNAYVDLRAMRIYKRDDFYKMHEALCLSRFLERFHIDLVIDVGANRGQFAQGLRKNAGYTGQIISLEPLPGIYDELVSGAADDAKWHCRNLALSDHSGSEKFHVMRGDQFSSFLEPSSDEFSSLQEKNTVTDTIDVQTLTLDDFYREIKTSYNFNNCFLKLDTQGYDHIIIASGNEVLYDIFGIQSEIAFSRLYKGALNFSGTLAMMDQAGFSISSIYPNNAGHFPYCIEQDAIFFNRSLAGTYP